MSMCLFYSYPWNNGLGQDVLSYSQSRARHEQPAPAASPGSKQAEDFKTPGSVAGPCLSPRPSVSLWYNTPQPAWLHLALALTSRHGAAWIKPFWWNSWSLQWHVMSPACQCMKPVVTCDVLCMPGEVTWSDMRYPMHARWCPLARWCHLQWHEISPVCQVTVGLWSQQWHVMSPACQVTRATVIEQILGWRHFDLFPAWLGFRCAKHF